MFELGEPGTLAGALVRRLADEPDRALLYGPWSDSGSDTPVWISRGGFLEKSATVSRRLAAAGLVAGDRVLVSGPSSIDLAVAHVGCLRLGLVVVPTNGAYRDAELSHVMADCRPSAALVDYDGWGERLVAMDPDLVVAGTAVDLPDGGPPAVLDRTSPDDPAIIGYTSGTTGRPKGAVLTQANLLAGARSVEVAWRWTEADRLMLCLPLFHMHGLGVGLHTTLLVGGSAVLQSGFDPDAVLDGLAEHRWPRPSTVACRSQPG